MRRVQKLTTGETYHVFSKSIEGFKIFNYEVEFLRMTDMMRYFQLEGLSCGFARFIQIQGLNSSNAKDEIILLSKKHGKLVKIVSFCLMPTHIHLAVQQLIDGGICLFMGNLLNSYARYFNMKYKRLGPLWATRFKAVLIEDQEQLLHLTRYIHLNPTSSGLVSKPSDWPYSSYKEYIHALEKQQSLCEYTEQIDLSPREYKKFVESYVSGQRERKLIKHLMIDKN